MSQKIQTELSGHDVTLEDMRKKNQDKDSSQRVMGQIDLTQVSDDSRRAWFHILCLWFLGKALKSGYMLMGK